MADDLKPGDRVVTRKGEAGTILRIDGGLAQVQFNSSIRKSVATAALKKITGDAENKS